MAAGRKQLAQEPSGDQLSARMRSFGLGKGNLTVEAEPVEEKEVKEPVEGESETLEGKADASPEETASEDAKPEGEEKETTKEEKPKPEWEVKLEAAEKARKDAEERERKRQAAMDRQEAQHQREVEQLYKQFEALKQNLTPSNGGDGLKPDDLVDKKTVDRMVAEAVAKAAPQRQTASGPTPEQTRYINLHPEYDEVIKFGNEKNLLNDPALTSIPTDTVGLFLAIQNKRLTARMEQMEKDNKAAIDKALAAERKKLKERGTVPPTGGSGARKGDTTITNVDDLTATERMFKGYFDKHAGGKTQVIQVRR